MFVVTVNGNAITDPLPESVARGIRDNAVLHLSAEEAARVDVCEHGAPVNGEGSNPDFGAESI